MSPNTTRCRACKAEITFITTTKGKSMPVNVEPVQFVPDVNAKNVYVLPDGIVVHGVEPMPGDPDVHVGYISHFATCPKAHYFRRRTKAERKEEGK